MAHQIFNRRIFKIVVISVVLFKIWWVNGKSTTIIHQIPLTKIQNISGSMGKKSCIFSQQPHKKLNSRSMQRTTFLFKEKISCSTFHGPLGKNFFDSSHFSSISRLRWYCFKAAKIKKKIPCHDLKQCRLFIVAKLGINKKDLEIATKLQFLFLMII